LQKLHPFPLVDYLFNFNLVFFAWYCNLNLGP
jgi:hypothetical protein